MSRLPHRRAKRASDWIARWTDHGGKLGQHDGAGNLILTGPTIVADDDVARDLVSEINGDRRLADDVAILLIAVMRQYGVEAFEDG